MRECLVEVKKDLFLKMAGFYVKTETESKTSVFYFQKQFGLDFNRFWCFWFSSVILVFIPIISKHVSTTKNLSIYDIS